MSDLPAAELSPCRAYRYELRRQWGVGPKVAFIMLNPSTADERQDDPTIRRCIGFAKSWGYGGLVVGNLFAYRATDPRKLRNVDDPVGPSNDMYLLLICQEATNGAIVCAWGGAGGGSLNGRSREVLHLMRDEWGYTPWAFGLTAAGEPKHPLYLLASSRPIVRLVEGVGP